MIGNIVTGQQTELEVLQAIEILFVYYITRYYKLTINIQKLKWEWYHVYFVYPRFNICILNIFIPFIYFDLAM